MTVEECAAIVNRDLADVESAGGVPNLRNEMWDAINDIVPLSECEIFQYGGDSDSDPAVSAGTLWSFHFFFFCARLKKLVYLTCSESSKYDRPEGYDVTGSAAADDEEEEEPPEEEDEGRGTDSRGPAEGGGRGGGDAAVMDRAVAPQPRLVPTVSPEVETNHHPPVELPRRLRAYSQDMRDDIEPSQDDVDDDIYQW